MTTDFFEIGQLFEFILSDKDCEVVGRINSNFFKKSKGTVKPFALNVF